MDVAVSMNVGPAFMISAKNKVKNTWYCTRTQHTTA
jgi:hypothetical protein